jgi:adenylate kinase
MKPAFVFVGGPQGVGKTTLLKAVAAKFKGKGVVHFPVGQAVRDFVSGTLHTTIPRLRPEQTQRVRAAVLEQISRVKAKVVLLDDHFVHPSAGVPDFGDGTTQDDFRAGIQHPRVDAFVFIEAPVDQLERRIAQSTESSRRWAGPNQTERNLVAEKIDARARARDAGIPLTIIQNHDGNQPRAQAELERVVRRHL